VTSNQCATRIGRTYGQFRFPGWGFEPPGSDVVLPAFALNVFLLPPRGDKQLARTEHLTDVVPPAFATRQQSILGWYRTRPDSQELPAGFTGCGLAGPRGLRCCTPARIRVRYLPCLPLTGRRGSSLRSPPPSVLRRCCQ
jgi:hypothetical protein